MNYNLETFEKGLSELNIVLTDLQKRQFTDYFELLVEKNKVMNLTAITEFDEVIEKHFLDSLACCGVYDFSGKDLSLIDVGTGAGFPGIPLKIVFPNLKVTLLDSLNKRIDFLKEVSLKLGLENIDFVHGRAEDVARDEKFRERYDLVVSRAVAGLPVLLEYDTPFIKTNGIFISYKADNVEEELICAKNAMESLCVNARVEKVFIPGTEIKRSIVIFEKYDNTPDKYPRKAGMPSKKPL